MIDARRVSMAALLLLPVGLITYLAFNSGGFYPGPTAYVAIILCVALLLRVTLAEDPFGGFSWRYTIATALMSLLALWTLLSAAWSHSDARALVEFDRILVYLLAIVLFGSLRPTTERLVWGVRVLARRVPPP